LKKFDGINIIPFVDIMLVLLAIVLTTSTLVEKRLIPLSLPSSVSAVELKNKDITITIDKEGRVFWEREEISKEILEQKVKELKKEDSININCDKNSKFENFVYILDSLKLQGLNNISIITKSDE